VRLQPEEGNHAQGERTPVGDAGQRDVAGVGLLEKATLLSARHGKGRWVGHEVHTAGGSLWQATTSATSLLLRRAARVGHTATGTTL
jgi:hypothetical protein